MRYYAYVTEGRYSMDNPLAVVRTSLGVNVESICKSKLVWINRPNIEYKLITGDNYDFDDITEEQAFAIIERWKKEVELEKQDQ